MWPYFLMFLVPVWNQLGKSGRSRTDGEKFTLKWWVAFLLLSLVVGLRHQVGGDWSNYAYHYSYATSTSWIGLLSNDDPGYWLILGLAAKIGLNYQFSNFIFGTIFSFGLICFCKEQPRPWLALAVSIPYLVIVLGMGYTRQGVALSFAMLAIISFKHGRILPFVAWVALGATFHKSAVLLVPLAALATPRNRLWTAVWVGAASLALYKTLLAESVDTLLTGYIDKGYQSEGAAVRVLMNVLPAVLLLWRRKRFNWSVPERNLWTMLAVLALFSVILLLVSPSSTAVDRLALYLIPLQMYVFSRLSEILGSQGDEKFWVNAVIIYYAAIEAVWLLFATHAFAWLPYQFYPWIWLWE